MTLRSTLLLAATAIGTAAAAQAQEVTLRLHHFLPERANLHANMLVPWAERVEAASEGRIDIEIFAAMSLGGGPPDLYDQAADGAVDIVLTLPGYTSGRFNKSEVFELPFMMTDSVATSRAYWSLIDSELQDGEFDETHILSGWVHGPGVIHTNAPVNSLEDLAGLELRGPTRLTTDLLGELGAIPVGMPLPAIPENLSKGVIDGAVIPWEVAPSIRIQELVTNHTEIGSDPALYTSVFVLAMNLDAYDAMPDDLRAILDAESGDMLATFAGQIMIDYDAPGRVAAEGNNIITLDAGEVARWIEASAPVYERWITRATDEGFDGQALIDQARALIDASMN